MACLTVAPIAGWSPALVTAPDVSPYTISHSPRVFSMQVQPHQRPVADGKSLPRCKPGRPSNTSCRGPPLVGLQGQHLPLGIGVPAARILCCRQYARPVAAVSVPGR